MEKRTIYRGLSKASFKSKKEYSFTEAQEILGPCKRKKITYLEQVQYWREGGMWETNTDAGTYPRGWFDKGDPQILEEFDVWVNEQDDMLLAQPLP